ncbi:chlorophyllase/cutinase-like alpha/beta fold protein [Paenibacillus harenae]|uniref:poly(ethylene terephthalate) hydrolase family protein n=1 Tax=Paenibacillus harenae TaxID=306543 RepID=UPI00040F2FFE|nr:alpha/beta hydrolase [Paenibacillus harenae]
MDLALQEPEQQAPEPSRIHKVKGWLINRYRRRNRRDTRIWRIASGSLALFGSLSILAASLGMPTGFGTLIDAFLFIVVNMAAMVLCGFLLSILLSLMLVPVPRRFTALLLYVGVETYLILYFAELGVLMPIVLSAVYTVSGAASGWLLGLLIRSKIKPVSKVVVAVISACVIATAAVMAVWPGPAAVPQRNAALDSPASTGAGILDMPNPAVSGRFAVRSFTYGSGKDKHRDWFGDDVGLKTASVDASSYITKWPELKTYFWGFDEHALPINGRVWMPEGGEAYPIALIVHGNHLMEHFSDEGYAYIGELLASHGIIAISVDENFLNYSVWSGIPNHDMKMRAWVLLKHLQQLQQLNKQDGNPLTGKIDFSRVALIGHSRGGQAAAMAADADRWFKGDQTLAALDGVNIESVIAIAPTDKKVEEKSARLVNVNYLTLQGAKDADVNNFYGDRQYNRVSFGKQSERFKAALYIEGANHSQFNTAWGRSDERSPGGLFLNRAGLLEEEEQRDISKIYVSAFLQATLLGEAGYKRLFQDYRTGGAWLPETVYTNRYEEAGFTEITRYDRGGSKTSLPFGGKAEADGMILWQLANAKDRDNHNKGTKGIELEWDQPGAEYELELSRSIDAHPKGMTESSLVFSMANMERDLIAKNAKAKESNPLEVKEKELPPLPAVVIGLTFEAGGTTEVGLEEIMPVSPPAYTAFTSLSWLESRMKKGKFKNATEPVFQTFVVPLATFGPDAVEANEISRITFRFVSGPGKVMLDDIGFMP